MTHSFCLFHRSDGYLMLVLTSACIKISPYFLRWNLNQGCAILSVGPMKFETPLLGQFQSDCWSLMGNYSPVPQAGRLAEVYMKLATSTVCLIDSVPCLVNLERFFLVIKMEFLFTTVFSMCPIKVDIALRNRVHHTSTSSLASVKCIRSSPSPIIKSWMKSYYESTWYLEAKSLSTWRHMQWWLTAISV